MSIMSIFEKKTSTNNLSFIRSNQSHVLDRIKKASVTLIILYPYYFYVDFVLFKDVQDIQFRYTLTAIHLLGLTMSIVFLFISRLTRHKESFLSSLWPARIINTYIALYLSMGALASINSQFLTGNIYGYVIITIGVAVIFPIRPRDFFFILLIVHTGFLAALSMLDIDKYALISKQVNTTVMAVIAFLIVFSFYSYRRNDFITHLKLKEKEEQFRKLFEVNPYPLILTRYHDGKVMLINKKALEFYDLSPCQIENVDANLVYKSPDERLAFIKELSQAGSMKNQIIEQRISPDLSKWVMANFELIEYANETCILAAITDITDLKKIEQKLTQHASIDMLTGIMNRRRGIEILQDELMKADERHREFVVCFLDINNLKEVNDQYGHAEGDHLIRTVSQILSANIEQEDILFRYGGDELIIVFFDKSIHEVHETWQRIQNTFQKINNSMENRFLISVSHGLYQYRADTNISLEEIISIADREMYKEKNHLKSMMKA